MNYGETYDSKATSKPLVITDKDKVLEASYLIVYQVVLFGFAYINADS